MPNWTAISADDLKAAGHGAIIDRARTAAVGTVDPVTESIAKVVARVRRKVRQGNRLDTDATKIPGSLKDSAVLLIIAALAVRIPIPLTSAMAEAVKDAREEINAIGERKEQVEPADDPDADAGPVNPGNWNSENKLIGRMHPVPPPAVQRPGSTGYANPDAPEDNAE
jgi:hypothetical protein